MSQDTFPTDALVKEVEDYVADQPQETVKRKRQMSEKQLLALAEGRKKRWLKKQEAKEESKSSSEEDSSDETTSGESTEETDTATQTETSTTDESTGQTTSSEGKNQL